MENQLPNHRRVSIGVLAVIGGFLIHLTIGGILISNNMTSYIMLYMGNNTISSNETFWLWNFDLSVFGFGSSMALGGYIEAKIGPFFTLILGSWIMSCSIIACYWTIQVNVIALAVTHGLLSATGAGIAYSVSMAAPIEWFPESKGLICGILVSGMSFGVFQFDALQSYLINQDITKIRINDPQKVPLSFFIVGVIHLLIQLVGTSLTKRRKPIVEENPDNDIVPLFQSEAREINLKPHQLIYQRDFWILWMSLCLNGSVTIVIMMLSHAFGTALGFSHLKLLIVEELSIISNVIGRITWGCLSDIMPYKVLMSIITLLIAVMLGTFYCCSLVGDLNINDDITRFILYFIWMVILYFLIAGNYSIFPAMCVKTFGVRHFAGNYGVLFTAFSFSALVTSLATYRLLGHQNGLHKYLLTFTSGCGLSILSCFVTQFHMGKLRLNYN